MNLLFTKKILQFIMVKTKPADTSKSSDIKKKSKASSSKTTKSSSTTTTKENIKPKNDDDDDFVKDIKSRMHRITQISR